MATKGAQVDFEGDFFKVDPGETMLKNLQKMMEGIAAEGAAAAKANLEAGAGGRALVRATGDRVADHVIGRTRSLVGKQWVSAAVVQVSNQGMDATTSRSLMAAASRVEGKTRSLRRVATQLRSARAMLAANLTEGFGD